MVPNPVSEKDILRFLSFSTLKYPSRYFISTLGSEMLVRFGVTDYWPTISLRSKVGLSLKESPSPILSLILKLGLHRSNYFPPPYAWPNHSLESSLGDHRNRTPAASSASQHFIHYTVAAKAVVTWMSCHLWARPVSASCRWCRRSCCLDLPSNDSWADDKWAEDASRRSEDGTSTSRSWWPSRRWRRRKLSSRESEKLWITLQRKKKDYDF